jgi:hypothetical protein
MTRATVGKGTDNGDRQRRISGRGIHHARNRVHLVYHAGSPRRAEGVLSLCQPED